MGRHVLSERVEKFCLHYAQTRRGAESYRIAYDLPDATEDHARQNASRLLKRPKVRERIAELVRTVHYQAKYGMAEMIRMFADMAEADPNELIGLRIGACRRCYGDGHRYQWDEVEYLTELERVERHNLHAKPAAQLALPDIAGGFGWDHTKSPLRSCPGCRGEGTERVVARDTSKLSPGARLLYGGVKQTRNGLEVLIADRQKARESLMKLLGLETTRMTMDGTLSHATALVDLTKMDPAQAARAYQEFIAQNMTADAHRPR